MKQLRRVPISTSISMSAWEELERRRSALGKSAAAWLRDVLERELGNAEASRSSRLEQRVAALEQRVAAGWGAQPAFCMYCASTPCRGQGNCVSKPR